MTIKDLRTASGMTQKAFAEYFGIPKRTIEDWESQNPSAKTARCLPYVLSLIAYKLEKEGLIRAADTPDSADET